MRFVIVGCGRVGMRTATTLASEGHDLVVVEQDPEKAERARQNGYGVIEGDGGDERVLVGAGLDDADALAALTSDLNANFTACMVANDHDCRTVLRIDEDYREEIYQKYADEVDEVIYPERLGAIVAKNALLGGNIHAIADIARNLQLVELTVTRASPVRGYTLAELELPGNARLYAHGHRKEAMTIPMPQTEIEPGDRVALIAEQDALESVRTMLRG